MIELPLFNPLFFVKDYPGKGRGLCAAQAIRAGQLIESCPVILLDDTERRKYEGTRLKPYFFCWQEHDPDTWTAAVALGGVSLCNHSSTPNAGIDFMHERLEIELRARRPIEPGEEITFDYGTELWFEAV